MAALHSNLANRPHHTRSLKIVHFSTTPIELPPGAEHVSGCTGLSYSLLVAYIAKAGEVISSSSALTLESAALLFTGAMGGMLWLGGSQAAELVNGGLTVALLILFAAIVTMGGSEADFGALQSFVNWGAAPATLPIIFLSLVWSIFTVATAHIIGLCSATTEFEMPRGKSYNTQSARVTP